MTDLQTTPPKRCLTRDETHPLYVLPAIKLSRNPATARAQVLAAMAQGRELFKFQCASCGATGYVPDQFVEPDL